MVRKVPRQLEIRSGADYILDALGVDDDSLRMVRLLMRSYVIAGNGKTAGSE